MVKGKGNDCLHQSPNFLAIFSNRWKMHFEFQIVIHQNIVPNEQITTPNPDPVDIKKYLRNFVRIRPKNRKWIKILNDNNIFLFKFIHTPPCASLITF